MCIKSEFKEICLKLATDGWNDKGFLLTSKVCPKGVFCPCPGAIYMRKIIENVYKIRLRRNQFQICNIWAKRRPFCCHQNFVPNGLSTPAWGYIHNGEKMYIKSDFKANCFKPATNRQSDKGLLLTSKVVPKELSALTLGLYTYIKSFEMCIKSDFFFQTCSEWAKW